jgi:methylenetetrahydrofolate--tRNA-(uracil-5-)-methyltransferase
MTEAHETGDVAELVCSNSLKSEESQNAHGLLKAELRLYGCALLECADRARIPGGKALVVDRRRFSAEVQKALDQAGVTVERAEVCSLPWSSPYRSAFEMSDPHQPTAAFEPGTSGHDPKSAEDFGHVPAEGDATVVATGPLTSGALVQSLQMALGAERLFFYDAIAPIVAAESLDMGKVFAGSRYGAEGIRTKSEGRRQSSEVRSEESDRPEVRDQRPETREAEGRGGESPESEARMTNEVRSPNDRSSAIETRQSEIENPAYLNCPMTEEEYERFVTALLDAELHPLHEFEQGQFFEGCLPVEEIARRGRLALTFGPMKPVGLEDPRAGKRPFAVVQLRRENEAGTMWNLVGFQTRLKHPEQVRVFRLIPGLEKAEFLRLGSIHRNTYLDAPAVLLPTLQARTRPELFVAGQLTGVEGYVESIGAGLVAGANVARLARGEAAVELPAETMLGALLRYITTPAPGRFQPMNVNFGLLPSLPKRMRGRDKRAALAERALAAAGRSSLTIVP